MRKLSDHRFASIAALLLAITVAACSSGSSDPSLSRSAVEEAAEDSLFEEIGVRPDAVDCDGGLAGEIGDTQRCIITAQDGSRIGMTATVTEVDDDQIRFDVDVDDEVIDD